MRGELPLTRSSRCHPPVDHDLRFYLAAGVFGGLHLLFFSFPILIYKNAILWKMERVKYV